MKINKKITSLIVSSLLVFNLGGCQQQEEDETEIQDKEEVIMEKEPEIDVDALEEEYMNIVDILNHVVAVITTEKMGVTEAISLLNYVNSHRMEPTQELTILYNDLLDQLINLGIDYVMASDKVRPEIEEKILSILDEMKVLDAEINRILNNYQEF